jgi:MoxR-like ATPase
MKNYLQQYNMKSAEIILLSHALKRADQRGISSEAISLAIEYGELIYKQGLKFYICLKKSLRGIVPPAMIDKVGNTVVVVNQLNEMVTCYKSDNAIAHIRKKDKTLDTRRLTVKSYQLIKTKSRIIKMKPNKNQDQPILKTKTMETTKKNQNTAAVAVNASNVKLPTKIEACIKHLGLGLYERDEAIRLCLLALLSGEHVFMLGTPGVAKSLLATRLTKVVRDAKLFSYLMTRYTQPEEIFGPVMLSKLKQDIFEKKTDGYLPKAEVAFLDEIWKSNSSILNTLLTALNERKFYNGGNNPNIPLHTMLCASNELPAANQSLEALFDRLLVRIHVKGIELAENKVKLLSEVNTTNWTMRPDLQFSIPELKQINQQAQHVTLPEEIANLLVMLSDELAHGDANNKPLHISDRRLKKIVGLLKVSAFTSSRKSINANDCALVPYCLWEKPEDFIRIKDKMNWLIRERLYVASTSIESYNSDCQELIKLMKRRNTSTFEINMMKGQYHKLYKELQSEIDRSRNLDLKHNDQNGVSVLLNVDLSELTNRDLVKYRNELGQLRDNLDAAYNEFVQKGNDLNKAA